jgi:hypothetical protein
MQSIQATENAPHLAAFHFLDRSTPRSMTSYLLTFPRPLRRSKIPRTSFGGIPELELSFKPVSHIARWISCISGRIDPGVQVSRVLLHAALWIFLDIIENNRLKDVDYGSSCYTSSSLCVWLLPRESQLVRWPFLTIKI